MRRSFKNWLKNRESRSRYSAPLVTVEEMERRVLLSAGVIQPIWNTEIPSVTGTTGTGLGSDVQTAYDAKNGDTIIAYQAGETTIVVGAFAPSGMNNEELSPDSRFGGYTNDASVTSVPAGYSIINVADVPNDSGFPTGVDAVAVDGNGNIDVEFYGAIQVHYSVGLFQLDPEGQLTWGNGEAGTSSNQLLIQGGSQTLAIDPNSSFQNDILVAAYNYIFGPGNAAVVAAFNSANGDLDTNFGNGTGEFSFPTEFNAISADANGIYAASGTTVYEIKPDGSGLVNSFGGNNNGSLQLSSLPLPAGWPSSEDSYIGVSSISTLGDGEVLLSSWDSAGNAVLSLLTSSGGQTDWGGTDGSNGNGEVLLSPDTSATPAQSFSELSGLALNAYGDIAFATGNGGDPFGTLEAGTGTNQDTLSYPYPSALIPGTPVFESNGYLVMASDVPSNSNTSDAGDLTLAVYDTFAVTQFQINALPQFQPDLAPNYTGAAPQPAQQAMVDSLTLTFSQPTNLAAGDLTLRQTETGNLMGPISLDPDEPIYLNDRNGDGITWDLTFNTNYFTGCSLPDGIYNLVVDGSAVSDSEGQTIFGNPGFSATRFFGDYYGQGLVNGQDFTLMTKYFGQTVPGQYWFICYDGGSDPLGGYDNSDTFHELADRFGQSINSIDIDLAQFSSDASGGANPDAGLIMDSQGDLFGTTLDGGASGDGTIFEIPNGSDTIDTLAQFNGTDGSGPDTKLYTDNNGNLYGTTSSGGLNNDGTIFEYDVATATLIPLASFSSTMASSAPLIMDNSGNLYGTSYEGGIGTNNDGAIFELASGSSTITILASFTWTEGAQPLGGLLMGSNGTLYGTASSGGDNNGDGTIYELTKSGGTYSSTITRLAEFNSTNGTYPDAELIMDSSGNLYGTASYGGTSGDGTVFELTTSNGTGTGYSSTITVLADFNWMTGETPNCGLVMDANGDLFGTTSSNGYIYGTVWELTTGSNSITVLSFFQGYDGANSNSTLLLSNGYLFGTTVNGGYGNDDGTVFELLA